LLRVYDDILSETEYDTPVLAAFLDFSSAFDTIAHDLLIEKLHLMYGIEGPALNWIKTYLEERTLYVKIDDKFSKGRVTTTGVPQGSVLGPLLFCLYIQEIHDIVDKYNLSYHIFADDVQIYTPLSTNHSELQSLRLCVADIKKWAEGNSLKLNDNKTKFLQINAPNRMQIDYPLSYGDSFNVDHHVKNLGIYIDERLSFRTQINDVCKRGFYMLRQLWRIASKVKSIELKKQLVHCCILSKIDYCNSLYCGLPAKDIKKLQRLINASVRFVFCLKIGTSTTLYLKRAHLLPVNLRIDYKICVLVFKCLNGFAPAYLSCLIKRKVSLQSLRIFNDDTLLQLPDVDKRNFKNRCFSKAAPRIWNSLPRSIREIRSLFPFKSSLKTYLFDKF
jgi:hypothetical protein